MSSSALTTWALPRLSHLLPLDDESLNQIVTYTLTLSKEGSAEHLKNLLGDSPQSLEFITSYNSRRNDVSTAKSAASTPREGSPRPGTPSTDIANDGSQAKKSKRKQKPPLHSAGPARRPDNYGNVGGGYVKANIEEDYMAGSSRNATSHNKNPAPRPTSLSNALSLSEKPAALQLPYPTATSQTPSTASSRNPSPASRATASQKPPPSASGPLISDLPNVKSKSSSKATTGTSSPHKNSPSTMTTSSISDLTAAIAALEVSTNPALTQEHRTCSCNATLHPLFTPAPNCLSCGKIICALEGLQPCSFCGTPLLTLTETQNMIRALKEERGLEKMNLHNSSLSNGAKGTPEGSGDETATKARAHRDKLLQFQSQNAQRTKVHDEAADFDTPNLGSTQWMSPAQRALALKRTQKVKRDLEEQARPEWEQKKTVMSLDIKGGKVVRHYNKVQEERSKVEDEDADLGEIQQASHDGGSASRGGAFGRNPLFMAGGFVRPVWKAEDGKGKGRDEGDRKQTWRRVQDDNDEDNEKWILDGGVYGYEAENAQSIQT